MTQAIEAGFRAPKEAQAQELNQQFVVFSLSGQRYCIDIMMVREIRMVRAITALPGAAECVRGIINLRGTIVPVFDLRMRFGLGETEIRHEQSQTLVIASVGGSITGLLVDEVLDILTLPESAIAPVPASEAARRSPFFKGLVTEGESMLIVIDLDQSLPAAQPVDQEWAGEAKAPPAA